MKRLAILLVILFSGYHVTVGKNIFARRFLRIGNSMCIKDITWNVNILKRMSKAGYNGVFWDDAKIPMITKPSILKCAKDNLLRIRAEAEKLNIHFMCYSHGQTEPTVNDMNTAEPMPVFESPFTVTGSRAVLKSDHKPAIVDGSFEDFDGFSHPSWKIVKAAPGTDFFIDKSDFQNGSSSIRFENPGRSARMSQIISVKPGRAYELSVWIKTEDYSRTREAGLYVLAGQRWLLNVRGGPFYGKLRSTQGWQKYTIDFNSLEYSGVILLVHATYHANATGKIWFDNLSIREVGLYDRHERADLPILVKSENGTAFQKGKDFQVGNEELAIPAGSAIKNGQKLKVTWYQKAEFLHHHPEASFCFEDSWKISEENDRALNQIFGNPRGWFIKYSEWRLGGWDPNCALSPYNYKTSAEYVGGTQKRAHDLLRRITNNCNLETYVWNDAYDPYHNARPEYFLINGPVNPSWKYLDPETVILNWREGMKYKSMRFFAGMDPEHPDVFYRQMLSLWSQSPPDKDGGWFEVLDSLESEGMKDGAIIGMQYTTWGEHNYDNIEAYASACEAAGRWGSGPVPWEPVDPSCNSSVQQDKTQPVARLAFSASAASSGNVVIGYQLPERARVRLTAMDVKGRAVAKLQDGPCDHGKNSTTWDASSVAAGICFLRLSVDIDASGPGWDTHAVRKVVVH